MWTADSLDNLDKRIPLSCKNALKPHGNGYILGSFDLPSVAMLPRAALRMTGFYFLRFFRKIVALETRIMGKHGLRAHRQQKEMTHRFPAKTLSRQNRWISFFAARYCSYLH